MNLNALNNVKFFVHQIYYSKPNIIFMSIEQKRKECITAANDLTQALVDHLNVGYVKYNILIRSKWRNRQKQTATLFYVMY